MHFGATILVVAALVALGAGCVREQAADAVLHGVTCDAGPCLNKAEDRQARFIFLTRTCGIPIAAETGETVETDGDAPKEAPQGLHAQRMTLTGAGNDVLLFGPRVVVETGRRTTLFGSVLGRLHDPDDCPFDDWAGEKTHSDLDNAAYLPGPGGVFLAFKGTWAAIEKVTVRDDSGWLADRDLPQPSGHEDDPGLDATVPSPLALALPGDQIAVVRAASNQNAETSTLPLSITWLSGFRSGSSVLESTSWQDGEDLHNAVLACRGQLRAFAGLAPQDLAAGCFALVGEEGSAEAICRPSQKLPWLLGKRPALNEDNTAEAPTNYGAAAVRLPLRRASSQPGVPSYPPGAVLFIGGGVTKGPKKSGSKLVAPQRPRLDIFDPTTGTWPGSVGELPRPRKFPSATLLPDGTILVAGGSDNDQRMLYIDPRANFSVREGTDHLTRPRVHNSNALVMADGRVVVAGGLDSDEGSDSLKISPDLEIWEPPYLRAAADHPRPVIRTLSTTTLRAGASLALELEPGSPPISEVVLLGYGNTFLGNDANQRLVELDRDPEAEAVRAIDAREEPPVPRVIVTGPPAAWAPAGSYLLFVLSDSKIPSVGVAVDVMEEP